MGTRVGGQVFDSLPSDLVTWATWKEVATRTNRLTAETVFRAIHEGSVSPAAGFRRWIHGDFRFVSLPTHKGNCQPISNVDAGDLPLLVTFDASGAFTRIYERRVDDRVSTFVSAPNGKLGDEQTHSIWVRTTGLAVEDKLNGKQLQRHQAVPSFMRAWITFHPQSRELGRPMADEASE